MKLSYTNINGYQIPNLTMGGQPTQNIGKYGRQRMNFLRENDPLTFEEMLMDGTLYVHLAETDETVQQMVEQAMAELLRQAPAPDRKTNPLGWTQHMNSIKQQAEELATPILYDL